MIVRINTGAKPAGAVLYNEDKVAHGEARFLCFVNGDVFMESTIRTKDKINVLNAYAGMNPRISKPAFHTSLAFHPSEQLSDEKLSQIGQQYMERLGYGHQPYLVYRHEDTNHPHIHIVSVSVDAGGRKVNQDFQQRRSNAIRKALEKEHGLVEAEKQGKAVLMDGLLPEQMLTYKEPEAKKAIGNVVQTAMQDYRFSGIETFCAFLNQHRVQLNQLSGIGADGNPYQGITFQLSDGETDKRGQGIGPAIKASRFAFAPTMERLEQQFKRGGQQSQAGQQTTRKRINQALTNYDNISADDFRAELRSQGVQVLDTGTRFVYVDHKSRNVYDEDELGEVFRREKWQKVFVEQSKLHQPLEQPIIACKPESPVPAIITTVGNVTADLTPIPKVKAKTKTIIKTDVAALEAMSVNGAKGSSKAPEDVPQPRLESTTPASVQPVKTPVSLTPEQQEALARAVSQAYQTLREDWALGIPPNDQSPVNPGSRSESQANRSAFYFESQLIAQFPHQPLVNILIRQGVAASDARNAVTKFEGHKQNQLPDIRAKEESYFEQTTALLLKLTQKMPICAASRQAFLRSMDLDLVGFNVRHQQNDALYYPLTLAQQGELRSTQGVEIPFADNADKPTRSLYMAIAGEQPVPPSVSYYQIKGYQLQKSIDAQSFIQVAPSLNTNYLNQVGEHLKSGKPLLLQLASRGIVVEKRGDGSYGAGHTLSGVDTFVGLGTNLSTRLSQEYIPPLPLQRQAQQVAGVRSLVRLSQAIDGRDEGRIQRISRDVRKQWAEGPGATDTNLTLHQQLQKNLEKLYAQPGTAIVAQPNSVPIRVTPVAPATTVNRVEHSAYGQAVIAMLLRAKLKPSERGLLASQLGLQWQVGPGDRVQVMEKAAKPASATPRPGTIYELDRAANALFELPKPDELAEPRKSSKHVYVPNEEDRLVLVHQLAGRSMHELKLSDHQIARLQIQGIMQLTESRQLPSLQSWYNAARGRHIINQRPPESDQDTSARRYLTDLYQRGFVVHRSVIGAQTGDHMGTNKPYYSIGAIGMPVITCAALPEWLSNRMEQVYVPTKQGEKAGVTVLIEGGWCELMAKQTQRMQRLARVMDSEQSAGVAAAVKLIHQEYPALRDVSAPLILLDALASQSTMRLQQAQPLPMAATGRYKLDLALNGVSGQRVALLQQSLASLGPLSVVKMAEEPKPVVGQVMRGRNLRSS